MSAEQHKTQSRDMIRAWVEGFLRDRRVGNLSPFTIQYYRQQLEHFRKFAERQNVTGVLDITPDLLRSYLLDLETTGHNAGGRLAKYRAIRAFLLWYEQEDEPESWSNPIAKVKAPKVEIEPIEGASIEDIRAMLKTCTDGFTGIRDKAILLCLTDTGARARELLSLNIEDVDSIGGAVILRKTKNKEARIVFLGRKSRRAVRAYLRRREDDSPALWVTSQGERLAVKSLQGMLERRGMLAELDNTPSPHDFRRYHVLTMLREKTDLITLSRLTGIKDLATLKRYARQVFDDLQQAHEKASPADRLF